MALYHTSRTGFEQSQVQDVTAAFPRPENAERIYRRLLELARRRGVFVSDEPVPKVSNRLKGLYCNHPHTGGPAIWINPSQPMDERAFTLAHEIAHHLLGHDPGKRFTSQQAEMAWRDAAEEAADRYAARLIRFMERHLAATTGEGGGTK